MATFDYAGLVPVAENLISQFGMRAGLKRRINGGPDTHTRACTLVQIDYSPQERDGQLVQFTDRRYLISTEGLEIAPDPEEDRLIVGEELRIVTVKPLKPADVVLFYEVQARR